MNDLYNTFITCCCEVIPSGMTKTSRFMKLTAAFIYHAKCSCALHASFTCFLSRKPGCLFHTTVNQSFISSSAILPLGWHMTMILQGNCSFGIVLQLTVMYNGNLLPSANTVNIMVTSFHYLMFSSAQVIATTPSRLLFHGS